MLGSWLSVLPLVVLMTPLPVSAETQFAAAALSSVHVISRLRAACPDDMQLVDGNYCPAVAYKCRLRRDPKSVGCDEYVRNSECRYAPSSRRFCIDRYEWPNRVGERPRVDVSWHEARSLCASAGKRLCRRSEWTLACEGPKRSPYPHGWSRHPTACNYDRDRIEVNVARLDNPSTRAREIERLWQGRRIGDTRDCKSAFGVHDMVGNVDEWTDNREEGSSVDSTLNGGYWGPVRNTCRLTTRAHGPGFRYYQIGFRCCAEPQDGVLPAPAPEAAAERARQRPSGFGVHTGMEAPRGQ